VIRGRKKVKALLEYIVMVPAGIPGVVFAVGILLGWIKPPLALYGTLAILFVGYISHFLPVGVRSTSSNLVQVHGELEESARVAGSSWLKTLFQITIPLIKPGVLAGWTTLFVVFLRELGISIFLYSPKNEVVSVMLYEFCEDGDFQKASAMSVMVIGITVSFLLLVRRLTGTEVAGSVTSS
jgi:iron(III) transport system permease protein